MTTTLKCPYDDGVMRYDRVTHRYVLTKEGVFQILGINLDDYIPVADTANQSRCADIALNEVSEDVYDYLYEDCMNIAWRRFELAKSPARRQDVQEMLLRQIRYVCQSGSLRDASGVNLPKNQYIDGFVLKERNVGRAVKSYAENVGLKYIGMFGGVAPSYEEGDY